MLQIYDEQQFGGDNATFFEGYMYVTKEKYLAEHAGFDDYRFVVFDCGKDMYEYKNNLDNLANRKKVQAHYNKVLLDRTGIDAKRDASKLHMWMIDFDDADDDYIATYEWIRDAVYIFAKKYQKPIALNTHFQQDNRYKHIHAIYPPNDINADELADFLLAYSKDPVAASAPFNVPFSAE